MAQELLSIFIHMHTVGIVFLVLAMILISLEFFISGFGYFGIGGCACFVIAFFIRLIQGATTAQWIAILVVVAIIITSCVLLVINSKEKGTFNKNPFIQTDTSIPEDYSDPLAVYGHLLDKEGQLVTQCKPIGKAEIDGDIYEVMAVDNGFITKGAKIVVVDVEGENIYVERI